MAISTYTELKDAIITYMHREDFSNIFEIFVDSVEAEVFNNPIAILETEYLEETIDLVTVDGSNEIELPAGILKIEDIRILSNGTLNYLEYKTVDMLDVSEGQGLPAFYTIFENKIILNIVPDAIMTVKVSCEIEFLPLTESNPINSLLTNNSNIYLNGCLWKAKEWEGNMEESVFHYNQMINAIKGSNNKSYNKKYPNGLSMGFKDNWLDIDSLL